jgi:photosystem II stability/assembly factor-like uncharacterized protein
MQCSKSYTLLIILLLFLGAGCSPSVTLPSENSSKVNINAVTDDLSPAQDEVVGSWGVIRALEINHSTQVAGFIDGAFGITVGHAGEVHYTTDGGETWPKADNVSQCRYGLDIVDRNLAWNVGNGGNVRVSTDSGRTWKAVTGLEFTGVNPFISFIDDQIGWAGYAEKLWSTNDGGQTWMAIPLPEKATELIEISLRTANAGYLIDNTGVLFTTQDGGKSWVGQILDVDLPPLDLAHSAVIRFIDADHGLIIMGLAGGGTSKVVALRTSDGGRTWEKEVLSVPIGQFYLARDGTILTGVDIMRGNITVLTHKIIQ